MQKDISIELLLKLIDDYCYDIAISSPADDTSFSSKLKTLADNLRLFFDSEYCAIGKVCGDYAEDCVVSFANSNNELEYKNQIKNSKWVKRAFLDNKKCGVCRSLLAEDITYLNEKEIRKTENFKIYKRIIGANPLNSVIIPVRDKEKTNLGYIQLINSKKTEKEIIDVAKPFGDCFLKLIGLIHRRDELKDAYLFKKDYDFISIVQGMVHNVDELLRVIMKYLSNEFGATIVTYRIPLLAGYEGQPLFYLRECYISENVAKYYNSDDYFRERLIKGKDWMGGYKKLLCKNNDSIIIAEAKDSEYYKRITDKNIQFRKDTLVIPILRDFSETDRCFLPEEERNKRQFCDKRIDCPYRFAKYIGIFRLRFSRELNITETEETLEWPSEDDKKRLLYLAKHVSALMNSILDNYENEIHDSFQKSLKESSFTSIKEFDEQIAKIIKNTVHTKICAYYKCHNGKLTLSATSDNNSDIKDNDFRGIIEKYRNVFSIEVDDELENKVFDRGKPIYYVSNTADYRNSVMIVPVNKKDRTKLGLILLVGKNENNQKGSISKTFWEYDKKHIEYIVDVLTRIQESDPERLVFLSQLSHELLWPITELVYRNEYKISSIERNNDSYIQKDLFIKEMQNNIDLCMSFKYIIEDVAFLYSLRKGETPYYFEMADFNSVILEAIRLFEEEAAASKQITIKANLDDAPDKLLIDKSRMMQVAFNLLKNAIQYSFVKEIITISYMFNAEKNCHEYDFSDNGIPINPKEKDEIFNLFTRSKQAIKKKPNGTGIGLYLVKQIMIAHGGDCYVKEFSYPTTFALLIPK